MSEPLVGRNRSLVLPRVRSVTYARREVLDHSYAIRTICRKRNERELMFMRCRHAVNPQPAPQFLPLLLLCENAMQSLTPTGDRKGTSKAVVDAQMRVDT